MDLPSALTCTERIAAAARHDGLLVGLDYDGTLTPITDRPADARLDEAMRDVLVRLAARWPVWIVSGRDLTDVRARVALSDLGYAGCHGFDIAGPGVRYEVEAALRAAPELERLELQAREAVGVIEGVRFEVKRFTFAVHYRQVAVDAQRIVIERALALAAKHPALGVQHGKCVLEFQPSADWNKGAAVRWIAARFGKPFVLYVGDDTTDEHAFAVVREHGAGILVADPPRRTAATLRLRDPAEVRTFLERLVLL